MPFPLVNGYLYINSSGDERYYGIYVYIIKKNIYIYIYIYIYYHPRLQI